MLDLDLFAVIWTAELALAFLLGPAGQAWLRARRARRDFPRALVLAR